MLWDVLTALAVTVIIFAAITVVVLICMFVPQGLTICTVVAFFFIFYVVLCMIRM